MSVPEEAALAGRREKRTEEDHVEGQGARRWLERHADRNPGWHGADRPISERTRRAGDGVVAAGHDITFATSNGTTAGGVVEVGPDFAPHVVEDRELITGQNPRSDHPISQALIAAFSRVSVDA